MYEGKQLPSWYQRIMREKLIGAVLRTIPDFADLIIVVDDASTDQTLDVAASYRRQLGDRLALLSHKENQGVGAAITSGYKQALARGN